MRTLYVSRPPFGQFIRVHIFAHSSRALSLSRISRFLFQPIPSKFSQLLPTPSAHRLLVARHITATLAHAEPRNQIGSDYHPISHSYLSSPLITHAHHLITFDTSTEGRLAQVQAIGHVGCRDNSSPLIKAWSQGFLARGLLNSPSSQTFIRYPTRSLLNSRLTRDELASFIHEYRHLAAWSHEVQAWCMGNAGKKIGWTDRIRKWVSIAG